MRPVLRSRFRALLVLSASVVLASAIGMTRAALPVEAGVNYTIPVNVSNATAADLALASATSSIQLNQTAATVALANAGNGTVLAGAVATAFANLNSQGDQTGLANAFISGFVSGTGSGGNLDNGAASQLVDALFSANVSVQTIVSSIVGATGGANPANWTPTSSTCSFLAAVLSGPGGSTIAQQYSSSPNPFDVCFAPPPTS